MRRETHFFNILSSDLQTQVHRKCFKKYSKFKFQQDRQDRGVDQCVQIRHFRKLQLKVTVMQKLITLTHKFLIEKTLLVTSDTK